MCFALVESVHYFRDTPTFQQWKKQLQNLGYTVEHRELVAADYGAPTIRKRFVLVARCDGRPVEWPAQTHNRDGSGGLKKWVSAAEIIDWTQPAYSIFATRQELKDRYGVTAVRPLAENTLRRIIRGVDKFTIRSGRPFLVSGTAANLIQYHAEQTADCARVQGLSVPLSTVDAANRYGLTAANLVEYYGNGNPLDLSEPLHTVTAKDREALLLCRVEENSTAADLGHWPEVRALLNRFCGCTLAEDDVLLLTIGGTAYYIADILLRMLTPRELYRAMGFPPDYVIDHDYTGKPYPKSAQVARCGNAVCPPMAAAVVRANLPEWCGKGVTTMAELTTAVTV